MKNKKGKNLLEIVKIPSVILRNPNESVIDFESCTSLIIDMIYTMNHVKGVGIAAPQIGKNIRLFIALIDKQPLAVFNPEIIKVSEKVISFDEGCLSLPGESVKVTRPYEILVKYQDVRGRVHNRVFEGFNSVFFLHEFDHVLPEGGKLITDYLSNSQKGSKMYP